MPVTFEIKLDKRFYIYARGIFEKYNFQVGVLNDAPHKDPKSKSKGLKTYAGGPARKVKATSHKSIEQVSKDLRKNTGINIYTAPFDETNFGSAQSDIIKFVNEFFKNIGGKGSVRRMENLLQAVVRNPILRGDYGRNSRSTVKSKGFNRYMIDTAQLFRAIKAKVTVGRRV